MNRRGMNPNCWVLILLAKCGMNRAFRSLVNTFASVLISEIGRQLRRSFKSPFFGSGHIQVERQLSGNIANCSASLKTWRASWAVAECVNRRERISYGRPSFSGELLLGHRLVPSLISSIVKERWSWSWTDSRGIRCSVGIVDASCSTCRISSYNPRISLTFVYTL
jgi:hypothetical protein